MKQMYRLLLSIITLFTFTTAVHAASTPIPSSNISWELNGTTLTLTGSGDMPGFNSSTIPWRASKASIQTVIVGEGITSIGEMAFWSCSNLISVSLPKTLTSIKMAAFSDCSSLSTITIPLSVTSIAQIAFEYTGLTEVTLLNPSPVTINADVFDGVDITQITLNIPAGSFADYSAAPVWSSFGTIDDGTSGAAVTGVSLNTARLSLTTGATGQLTATVAPSDASNKNVTWSSSNPAVAAVSGTGAVSAKAAGTTIITVTTADGGYTAICTVTVTDPAPNVPLTGMYLPKTTLNLFVNRGARLEPIFRPINASNKLTTWSSSNPDVVTVSSHGVVTGIAEGTAIITVTTDDGGYVATCTVTVTKESPVGNEEISETQAQVYPNPVTDVLHIQSSLPVNRATIYALNGSIVFERVNIENMIEVSTLPKGIYILKLTTGKGEEIHKIIKK